MSEPNEHFANVRDIAYPCEACGQFVRIGVVLGGEDEEPSLGPLAAMWASGVLVVRCTDCGFEES